ncbi:GDSL-type esterase/lipase family protein [Nocardia sp. alder85J]|uniref:DUF459 domain-containing protein n=1 Tax=Nocardia sp. alder85J TaxID=2862949 RepID=UPI001CD40188|nr:GDSL-type esterase/lipase family protein [Nocardia sp. alder85J]MCX4094562.1 GDSL-type esterase/lipase family protein [Nocardia sp. alder85J]
MTSVDSSQADALRHKHGSAISIGESCDLPADLTVELDPGATLHLGNRVSIRRGTTIQVNRGATIHIGNDVAIGEHVFLSAMVSITIGDGVGISNMVDLHDHNHRTRTHQHLTGSDDSVTPWASGFDAAPITIETGAILSNKTTVTAGVRIGENTLLAANAVATTSLPPNAVAAGSPARVIRTFDGPITHHHPRPGLRFGWWGTSLMEHLEAHNQQMTTQANLPAIGSTVTVEQWRGRGYVQRLHVALTARHPHVDFVFDNYGEGGATSRDVLGHVTAATSTSPRYDVAVLGCGINDVWRGFQGRASEAVDHDEYTRNYQDMLDLLTGHSRRVICIGEPPFGWEPGIDTAAANTVLTRYNTTAAELAARAGAEFIDVWSAFTRTAQLLSTWSPTAPAEPAGASPWSDGVHLSDIGDELMRELVGASVTDAKLIENLTTRERLEREHALQHFLP